MRGGLILGLVALIACGRLGFDARLATDDGGPADGSRGEHVYAYVIDGYSAATTKSSLRIFEVGSGGELTETSTSPFSLGAQPLNLLGNAAGDRLYVTSAQTQSIYTLAIDPATGGLSLLDTDASTVRPEMVALHPSGKWLYTPDWAPSSALRGYAIAAGGTLDEIVGSPWTHPGSGSTWIECHPDGVRCYVVENGGAIIYGFDVSAASGALSLDAAISWDSNDSGPYAALIESTGKYGFVSPDLSGGIPGFTIDLTTGALSTTPGSRFGSNANTSMNAAMDRTRTRLFVANDGDGMNSLTGYAIDSTTGALAHLPGSPFAMSNIIWSVATSPVADDVYTTTTMTGPAIVHYRATSAGIVKIAELDFAGLDRASRLTLVHVR